MEIYSFEQAGEILGVKVSKIRQWAKDHTLLVGRGNDGKRGIIADSIIESEGQKIPLPGLKGTFTLLLDGGYDADTATEWFLKENEFFTLVPLQMLREGHLHQVNRVAGMLAF